jgi:hypothetical protein
LLPSGIRFEELDVRTSYVGREYRMQMLAVCLSNMIHLRVVKR